MHIAILVVLFCGFFSAGAAPRFASDTGNAGCPPDSIVNCFVNPCRLAQCSRVPAAVCRANYCGGCSAQWFVGTRDVTLRCRAWTEPIAF
ncbi:hypothetical protein BV898_11239 [Hypsibius exemplaris]|uniref:ShKT domain-containing protein n=1 Tax=Hypsibius exemplaris TaxID=2072580 RepID=A0A1W0WH53_HYPEX|nr:hypothetical protein BV898_11239 [Hypsibius exemplaris]